MSNNAHDRAAQEEHFADIFARLREQDIEQFYAHYQLWVLRRRLPLLENQLEALREHLAENQQVTESLHPSALALAVLVRLQSNGVSDTDVLDLMLERGEDWLDRMMQRLDYCEQVEDFIQGDYTQWCVKSLDGAYDWIDSLLGSIKENKGRPESSERSDETTAELLLQKLSQDDEEAMLEVTLKQPATSLEVAAESSESSSAESLPSGELELAALTNEQTSTTPEKSEPVGQQEVILSSDEAVGAQEDSEIEQQPELLGWKDLEDLEAPDEQPVPWYSVDVSEDGTTSAPNGTNHRATMNDWITILQTSSTPEETRATEVISPTKSDQEQHTPTSEEIQAEEISSDERTILADETPDPEISLAEAEPLLAENLTSETNDDENKLLIDETRLAQVADIENSPSANKSDEITASAEKAEESEQFAEARAYPLEELEQAADEHKVELAKQREESGEAAQIRAEKAVIADDDAENAEAQHLANDPAQTNTEQATSAEAQPSDADLAPTNIEQPASAEVQPSDADLAQGEHVPAKLAEAQISGEETPIETTRTRDEQTASPQPQADELLLSPDRSGEPQEAREAAHVRETEEAARGDEIEIAAIVNDILNGEEGQEEQLAWYEYLELEEPANTIANNISEAPSEPEKLDDIAPGESHLAKIDTPESAEHAVVDESVNEQISVLQPESKASEEATEIDGWQSWNSPDEVNAETLPLALKEIQRTQPPAGNTRESIASEAPESQTEVTNKETDALAFETNKEVSSVETQTAYPKTGDSIVAEEASSIEAQTAHPETAASAIEDVPLKTEEQPASKTTDITEQPTLMLEAIPQTPRENTPARALEGSASQIIHRENTPVPMQFTQPMKKTKPLKKPGFWRRLFSFGRKRKR